jgi:hypothetical protein
MNPDDLLSIIFTGVLATALTDAWTLARRRLFAIPLPNFALVGRWISHMARGQVFHASIAASPKVRAELFIGWITHYFTGIAFACLLVIFCGAEWFFHPTLPPALVVGVGTVAAPFFIMQPAMGAGIAASRMPHPGIARFHSLVMHAVFGLGLYLAARLFNAFSTGE